MGSDNLQARIQHSIAELRGAHPQLSACDFALKGWREGGEARHALWLDIRWPQHQSIVSGPACGSPEMAVHAAFEQARRVLRDAHA